MPKLVYPIVEFDGGQYFLSTRKNIPMSRIVGDAVFIDPFTYNPSRSEERRWLEEAEHSYYQDRPVLEKMALDALAIANNSYEGGRRIWKATKDIHPWESEKESEKYWEIIRNETNQLIREKGFIDLSGFPVSLVEVGGSYYWWEGPGYHVPSDSYRIVLSKAELQTGFWKRLISGKWNFETIAWCHIDPRELKVNLRRGYCLESVSLRK